MAYKCTVCRANEVAGPNDICDLCSIGQDPYASALNHNAQGHGHQDAHDRNGSSNNSINNRGNGHSRKILLNHGGANTGPYGNDMTPDDPSSGVQVYGAGQVPTSASPAVINVPPTAKPYSGRKPATAGIVKNIATDNEPRSFIIKLTQALFLGIPYTLNNDITTFQVFPDYSGTSANVSGNACDQVVVYGKIIVGSVSENNAVEVFGKRDSRHNVIAKTIKNTVSGATVTANGIIPVSVIRMVALLIVCMIAGIVSTAGSAMKNAGGNGSLSRHTGEFIAVIILTLAVLAFFRRRWWQKIWFIPVIAGIAAYIFFPALLSAIISSFVIIGIIYYVITKLFRKM